MNFSVAERSVFILPKVQGEMVFLSAGSISPKLCQGTAFPLAEHTILAALIVGNFLRSTKIGSINRNVMTQGNGLPRWKGLPLVHLSTWLHNNHAAKLLWSFNLPIYRVV